MSPASQSASSGCTFTTTAFLNPAASNGLFHSSTAWRIGSRSSCGVVFSIHQVIGVTGSETAAVGSFFTSFQRVIKSRYGVTLAESMSFTCAVK